MKKSSLCAAIALVMAGQSAFAHATWIAERTGDIAVVRGEGSSSDDSYDPSKVLSALGMDADGNAVDVTVERQEKNALLVGPEDMAVVGANWDSGWWTVDADGKWHNKPASEVDGYARTTHYRTYAVSYVEPTDEQKPLGMTMEIVPQSDPTKTQMGDKLDVVVMMNGAPLEGVSLSNDVMTDWDMHSDVTNEDGETTIVVANNGLNVALVSFKEATGGENEYASYQAVLSFVAHGPEGH